MCALLVTDQLKSYCAAKKQIPKSIEHQQSRHLNNWADNSIHFRGVGRGYRRSYSGMMESHVPISGFR